MRAQRPSQLHANAPLTRLLSVGMSKDTNKRKTELPSELLEAETRGPTDAKKTKRGEGATGSPKMTAKADLAQPTAACPDSPK